MTRAQDVREVLAEQSSSPAERRSLETVAGALEETLSRDVPYRPQFKAELRSRLMAEARRRMVVPWYRRPAVWGSSVAAAAAVVVLGVGLSIYNTNPEQPSTPPRTVQEPSPMGGTPVQHLVSYMQLDVVALEPEFLPAGHPGPEPLGGLDMSQGLQVYQFESRADAPLFNRMAQGLGFSGQPRQEGGAFTAAEGARKLTMSADGQVTYTDTGPNGTGTAVDAAAVKRIARTFLDQAALPVPSLDPAVLVNDRGIYAVAYTPRVDDRPVINGRTVIQISPQGRIIRADAFVQGTQHALGPKGAIAADEGLKRAQQKGDATYSGVDLVYVRTVQGQSVFLQPYWRVYGATPGGDRQVRYEPALIPRKP